MSSKRSTTCDACGTEIPFGIACWMVRKGEDPQTGGPLVLTICVECHDD